MKSFQKISLAIALWLLITSLGFSSDVSKISDITNNPGKFSNEIVTIIGTVTQYTEGSTTTTSYYMVLDDFGGIIQVNTGERPPETMRKYLVTGTVVMDNATRRPILIEKSREPAGGTTRNLFIYGLAFAIIVLLGLILVLFMRGKRESVPFNKFPNVPSSGHTFENSAREADDFETIRIQAGAPPTLIMLPGMLEIVNTSDKGKTFRIAGYPSPEGGSLITIGREEVKGDRRYAHIQLTDLTVSRKQAEILIKNKKLFLRNLSEKNYSQVDGFELKVGEEHEIKPGSIIKTGEVEFRYNL